MHGKDYEHYKDTQLDVPPDQHEQIVKRWNNQVEELQRQKEALEQRGNTARAGEIQEKIDQIEDTKQRLKKSKVTNDEAIDARLNPEWSTIKDIHGVSHQAGMEGTKYGAGIGGGISVVQNLAAVCKGKGVDEAIVDIVKDTGKSAVISYGTAYLTSAMGGALQSSKNTLMQNLGKGNGPLASITCRKDTCKQHY